MLLMVAEDGGGDGVERQRTRRTLDKDAAQDSMTSLASSSSSSSSSSSESSNLRSQASSSTGTHRALMPSLFSHVPPTINFVLDGQKRQWIFSATNHVTVVMTVLYIVIKRGLFFLAACELSL